MSDSSSAPPSLDALACAALSDPGRVRAENQDAADVVKNTSGERLLIVADGMGGHLGGETASRMCLNWVERCFREPHGTPDIRLRRGLTLANEEIYSHALGNPELRGMGTTAVALLLVPGGTGWVAWVGDSRAYRLRDGVLEALTRDHSLMAERISLGVLTAEAAETHPRRHELTRALGQTPDVAVDVAPIELRPGDRYLLCSDGLHGYVPERALRMVLADGAPEACARTLVERANANGGADNVSVIVAVVPGDFETTAPYVVANLGPDPSEETTLPDTPSAPPDELDLATGLTPAPPAASAPPAEPGSLTFAELAFGQELAPAEEVEAPPEAALSTAELDALASDLDLGASPTPAPEPSPAPSPEAESGSLTFAEVSFGDVLAVDDEPAPESVPLAPDPDPDPDPEPEPALELALEPPPEAAPAPPPAPQLPLLDPPARREIYIPQMTPVRSRRLFDGRSAFVGVAATLACGVLAFALWRYTGADRAPEPAPPAPIARREPAPAPTPIPAPAPPAPVVPTPPPRPELAEIESPQVAKWELPVEPEPAPAPAPVALPTPTPAPAPPVPPAAPPAAADPGALATAAGFELPDPVERFVDDWLRAVSTRDAALLGALGLRSVPDEFAGSFATRDAYRLVAASIDEERSRNGRWFLRLVVSYAFSDATGRFRTQDEQRWILRDTGTGELRYEGRWQQ
jgi:serine/threonine protein phosphatase PrpC